MLPKRRRFVGMRPRLRVATAVVAMSASAWAAGGPIEPGAYCPLPEKGQKPVCLAPAAAQYGEFFAEVDAGTASEAAADQVERDLLTGSDDYLALSSLAYGYYQLAQSAAQAPDPDPVLMARLERWNEMLSSAYARPESGEAFRKAVRAAAEDIHAKAPPVGQDGGPSATLLETLAQIDDPRSQRGVRGALTRLFERWLGEDAP